MASQHEEALRKLNADHEAQLAAIQAQAVAKMKELIEKVSKGWIFLGPACARAVHHPIAP